MKYILHLLCFLLFICVLAVAPAQAQRKKESNNAQINSNFVRKDTLRDDNLVLFFTNIGQIDYYRNESEFKAIEKLRKSGDIEGTYRALHRYVEKFGVKNFHRDTYLLWRLGKLAERLGYSEKAKQIYQLVLKHHREGNNPQARLFEKTYDSIAQKDKDYFLPVEYYYSYANASANIDTLDIPESIYLSLGDSVNSISNDYAPALSNNDLILIFTSQRNLRREGVKYVVNEDLFYSRKADSSYITQDSEGARIDTIPWTEAKPFVGLNSPYNEGSACISKNERTVYFSRCGSPDGYGNCDIYVAHRLEDGTWGRVRNLGINVNSIGWDSHPALSHSEDTLFFASDRLGGFGLSDIYFTYRNRSQFKIEIQEIFDPKKGAMVEVIDTVWQWAPARNIGPVINTRNSEVSPFYHPKYDILYFSSNGQLVNFGGFDIYKAYRWQGKQVGSRWSEPINIGPLVNYKFDEYYFTIDTKAKNLYYAKTVDVKFYDYSIGDSVERQVLNLHTATLPMEARPEATAVLNVALQDSITGEKLQGIISIIDLDEGIEVAPRVSDDDGETRFYLEKNRNYLLIITGEDFFRIEQDFLFKGDTTFNIRAPSIKFKKWKFSAIEFAEASADITPQMHPDLDKLTMFLSDHPHLSLYITGHTDSQGNAVSNRRLSQRRADAIRQYILERGGFEDYRITAEGKGSDDPIVTPEETEEDQRINRRVEFEIIPLED